MPPAHPADQHLPSGHAGCPERQLRQCLSIHADVVSGGIRSGVTGPEQEIQGFSGFHRGRGRRMPGWDGNEKPRLKFGAVYSFSLCAVTRVATRSTIIGRCASMSWSGAWLLAWDHAAFRAVERAVLTADSATCPPTERVLIRRDTPASEVTSTNTAGCSRKVARSSRILPSVVASGGFTPRNQGFS